jgi:hypothetical protein
MPFFDACLQMFIRLRYPVSTPEDIANALGIQLNNRLAFAQFLEGCKECQPTNLAKYMSRTEAERVFCNALRKDRFTQSSLFSFYFNEGWLEFELQFDPMSRLRRVYLHHQYISDSRGHELDLPINHEALLQIELQETSDSLYIA